MKKTLLLVFLTLTGMSMQAQRFEWAKGYGSSADVGCHITGSVTDSLGNLYILGAFRNDSEWGTGWDAERLLPIAPYGPWPDNVNTIIAKISPDGEMVWKKVIHSNNGIGHTPYDIKKVGDTAFACLVEVGLPTEDHYTYWLDTLIPGRSDYPANSMYVDSPVRTAFIMFDFEGKVLEQHFLYLTYTDSAGNDFVHYYNYQIDTTPWLCNLNIMFASFDIDNTGNIYISRAAMDLIDDSISCETGGIRGIKVWDGDRLVGQSPVQNKPMRWFPQIMKFSPHFDTMLACRYVVQKHIPIQQCYITYFTGTRVDRNNNVYVSVNSEKGGDYDRVSVVMIDSIQNIFYTQPDSSTQKDFIVQFDSNLTPNWLITLNDSAIGPATFSTTLLLTGIDIDYDSNLLFMSGSTGRSSVGDTNYGWSILTYQGTPLKLKNDGFFIAFNLENNPPELYSYGILPAIGESMLLSDAITTGFCKNNRVFLQGFFWKGLRFPRQTITFHSLYDGSTGLAIFDYQGNVIGGEYYRTTDSRHRFGSVSLHDSILYLTGNLTSSAVFGNIPYPINGNARQTYIAKYVDTAFMTPYVKPTNNITATDTHSLIIYPNPANDKLVVSSTTEPIKEASSISMSGIREPLNINRNTIDVGNLQPGIYILEITTTNNKYHYKFIKQ